MANCRVAQLLSVTITLFILSSYADGAKILVISSPVGFSHHLNMAKISKILAKENEVVYLRNTITGTADRGLAEQQKSVTGDNPRLVLFEDPDTAQFALDVMSGQGDVHPVYGKWNQSASGNAINDVRTISNRSCHEMLRQRQVWQALGSEGFDAVVVDEFAIFCVVGYIKHYIDAPLIWYSTSNLIAGSAYLLNVPLPASYVTLAIDVFGTDMTNPTILNRAKNLVNYYIEAVAFSYSVLYRPAVDLNREYLGEDAPDIAQVVADSSLIVVNTDLAFTKARPLLPNIVTVGGVLCTDPKPLPKDLEQFMSSSGERGMVYVAFGTTVTSATMGRGIMDLLLDTFHSLHEYKVLWKLDINPDWRKIPDNVKVVQWAPQQDILGHKKIKAFVSHGGLNGVFEAIYHAVPTLVLPMFGDQQGNADALVSTGMALTLDKNNLHVDLLADTIRKLVNEKRYKTAALKCSAILKDHPQSPVDRLLYWVSYVVRHRGAPHLRVNTHNMSLVEYFNLDILAIFLLLLSAVLIIIYKLARACCNHVRDHSAQVREKWKTS